MRVFLLVLFLLAACTPQKKTEVYQSYQGPFESKFPSPNEPIEVTENTILLDSRPFFQYSLAHLPGAINVQWSDFSDSTYKGLLKADAFSSTRRLARLGIGPDSEVVIIAANDLGEGAGGRLAWTLLFLGVQNVQSVSQSYFKTSLTNVKGKPRKAYPIWKPILFENLLASKKEVLSTITYKGPPKRKPIIIDVRSESEYFGKVGYGKVAKLPDIGAINIFWKDFLNQQGRANLEIIDQLKRVGISRERRVICISNHGIRSAAVTMSLLQLGFLNVSNYAGGYEHLLYGN